MKDKQSQIWGSHLKNKPDEQNVLFCAGRDVQELPMADELLRSEERRVGKECRSRWSPYH